MNQKTLLAAGLALACTLSAPVFASDTILFDADGTGNNANGNGIIQVGSLDWSVGSTLNVGAIPTQQGDTFDVYSHAALAATVNPGGTSITPNSLNTAFEITFIAGFQVQITNVSAQTTTCNAGVCEIKQTIQLGLAANSSPNFYEVYYDDFSVGSQSNSLLGTGFNDGLQILAGEVNSLSGNFTSTVTFQDDNGNGTPQPNEPLLTVLLDSFGNDDWNGQQSITGEGATQLDVDVDFQDFDFFISNVSGLLQDLFFNTSNILPFDQTNPSMSFDNGAGGTIAPNIGDINGLTGPDILVQTDSNNSFEVTEVPEPNTVLLFALGLLLLGSVSRSHYLRKS